jgi:DNA repair ATPase RecN
LKVVLKELDQQIKEVKKQARLAPNLPDKLKLEKERKKLEAERDTAWKEYDWAAKEIEQNKDQLIDKVEKRLKQNLKDEQLFNFKWTLI